jgi:hypothetical protein
MDSIFKYCDAQGGLNILETLELKITPPIQFNDPFEFTPHVVNSNPQRGLKRLLKDKSLVREMYDEQKRAGQFHGNSRQFREHIRQRRSEFAAMGAGISSRVCTDLQTQLISDVSKEFGVLCLTSKPDSIVMWGHYCDKHQGLVVGFDKSWPLFHQNLGLQPVRYESERTRWDISRTMVHDRAADLILPKNAEWQYEHEERQIFQLGGLKQRKILDRSTGKEVTAYFQPVPSQYVVSVCLGTKASSALEAQVRALLKKPPLSHVKLQRARLHESNYALEIL